MEALDKRFTGLQRIALVLGIAGVALTVVLASIGWGNFFQSYLYSFLFWLGMTLGCLILLLIGHMAGGPWAAIIRRFTEAGALGVPLMLVLFIPILANVIFIHDLYPWTDPAKVAQSPIVQAKVGYLNTSFFIIRAVVFFAIWWFLAARMSALGKKQDETPDQAGTIGRQMQRLGAIGLVLFALSMTFASFDWGMSLSPEWFSGLYGAIFMIGQAISATAFIIIVTYQFRDVEPLASWLKPKYVQDLGNFLMAFTLFWAYVNVSQLIIIWSGNIVETNPWYVERLRTMPWAGLMAFVGIFHFAAPFLILFSRWVKRMHHALMVIAFWMLVARLVDLFFYIAPNFDRSSTLPLHVTDVTAVLGIGGLWFWLFFARMKGKPSLLPINDPRLEEHGHDDHGHEPASNGTPASPQGAY